MNRVVWFLCIIGFCAVLTGCFNKDEVKPAPPEEVVDTLGTCATRINLMAGQHTNAGSIIISNDLTNLYVTYTTTGGWTLMETHLFVGALSELPKSEKGVPEAGQFPYKNDRINNLTTYTYTIPLSSLPESGCISVAAHASVGLLNAEGIVSKKETAWGSGTRLNQDDSWAMYSTYCLCTDEGNGSEGIGGN